jgi:hypothetical protein
MQLLTETLDPEIPMDFEESMGSKSMAQSRQGGGSGSGLGMGMGRGGQDRLLVERMKRGEGRLKELRVQVRGYLTDKIG